jgi:diguanylate cyclase (GGDEF)-like protein
MRVGDGKPAVAVTQTAHASTVRRPAEAAGGAVRAPDTTTFLGIPEGELTPKVREAIVGLMRELETLRRDLARSNARLSELEQLADKDSLVPMYNRRAFVREMNRMMSMTNRHGTAVSLLFFDVNGLKAINDTYGHLAGDRALMHVATTLVDNVRGSDVVGRLGGDEFGVLLSHANESQAQVKAEGLAAGIERKPIDWERRAIPVRVAFGVYCFKPGEDPVSALANADQAMYTHKAKIKQRGAGG